jgi:hypothetical protein
MKKVEMKAVVKRKRPLLTKRHMKERLDFAIAHKDWTVEDWKRVVWSDETKINRLGSDGRKWVWKKAGEGLSERLVKGTKKFWGGSLMMWGCMMWEGVGYGCKIDGRMDGDLYVRFWMMTFKLAWTIMTKLQVRSFSSKTMTQNTCLGRPQNGLKNMTIKFFYGPHSPQISIQLNISGLISREG